MDALPRLPAVAVWVICVRFVAYPSGTASAISSYSYGCPVPMVPTVGVRLRSRWIPIESKNQQSLKLLTRNGDQRPMFKKTVAKMAVAVACVATGDAMAQSPGSAMLGGANGNVYQYSTNSMSAPVTGCGDTAGCGESGYFAPNASGGFGSCAPGGNGSLLGGGGGGLLGLSGDDSDGEIKLGGWLQGGYHNKNGFARFNTHADRFNLHQGWLYAEKEADGSDGLDWGFRVDAMYGVDGADTQSFGNNPGKWDFDNGFDHGQYAFAIPQAYVELANGDWSVKIGHFFTLVGYEVVTAPDNFFYSHAFTMYNSEPFTHTGAVATYEASDGVTLYGGWTMGWDTGFDRFGGGSSFLGGAAFSLGDDVTFTYITTLGDFGARGKGYSHSLVLDMELTDDLNYVIQSDYVDTDAATGPLGLAGDEQYGVNQYLIRKLNDTFSLGARYEWWNVSGVSVNDVTLGLNVKLMDDITIRPEVRHDWAPGLDYAETVFGVDAIITF